MIRKFDKYKIYSRVLAATVALCSQSLYGASFQSFEQSASSMGMAHADMASLARDASTNWFNPAGIMRFDSLQIATGVTNVHFDTFVDSNFLVDPTLSEGDAGGVFAIYGPLSTFVNFGTSITNFVNVPRAKGDTNQLYGYFHILTPLTRDCYNVDASVGLSIAAPWGWDSDYTSTDLVVYASRTKINSIAFAPTFALTILKKLSLAAQIKVERMSWHLSSEFARTLGNNTILKQWFCGYNLSLLYEFSPTFRVGGTWDINHNIHLSGNVFSVFLEGSAETHLRLPDTVSVGATWQPYDCLTFTGTFLYTNWNKFKSLNVFVNNTNSNLLPVGETLFTSVEYNFTDTYMGSLGLEYQANDRFKFRSGFGFETGANQNNFREIRFHDAEHYFYGIGFNYLFNCNTSLDFGYMFTYFPSRGIRHNPFVEYDIGEIETLEGGSTDITSSSGVFRGTEKTIIHSFGLQFNCWF